MINVPTATKFSPITVNDVFNFQSSTAVDFILIVDEFGQLKLSTAETSFSVDWMRAGNYTAHIQSKDGITELPFVKV